MRPAVRALVLVAAVLSSAAGPSAAAHPAPAAAPRVIVVKGLAFGPAPSGLRVGQTVEWDNKDIVQHSATARDGSFNLELPVGGRGRTTLKRAGKIAFYCRYHPGMTGVLVVDP